MLDLMIALAAGALGGLGLAAILGAAGEGYWKKLLGLGLLSHGIHLALFSFGTPAAATPPIVAAGETELAATAADPLPQALILTAIVISFGLTAFAGAVAVYRAKVEHSPTQPMDTTQPTDTTEEDR